MEIEAKTVKSPNFNISRRRLLGGLLGIAGLSTGGAACGITQTPQDKFFEENPKYNFDDKQRQVANVYPSSTPGAVRSEPIPRFTSERLVTEIENNYSKHLLEEATLREKVIPAWIDAYSILLGSKLTTDSVLTHITYFSDPISDPNQIRSSGWIETDDQTFNVTGIIYNSGAFKSNADYTLLSAKPSKGISYQRTAFLRLLAAYDTVTQNPTGLVDNLSASRVIASGDEHPESIFVNGFQVTAKHAGNAFIGYFTNFEQAVLDVVADNLSAKTKTESLSFNGRAPMLRDLLSWVRLPTERLVQLHQNSEILTLATELGKLSHQKRDFKNTTPQQQTADGLTVMQIFEDPRADLYTLDNYYPGSKQIVLQKYFTGTRK